MRSNTELVDSKLLIRGRLLSRDCTRYHRLCHYRELTLEESAAWVERCQIGDKEWKTSVKINCKRAARFGASTGSWAQSWVTDDWRREYEARPLSRSFFSSFALCLFHTLFLILPLLTMYFLDWGPVAGDSPARRTHALFLCSVFAKTKTHQNVC